MLTVSAVIPTYNGTRYLVEAVQSALAQTYGLLEIIVVDDGSGDDIEKLLLPFPDKVVYMRQENAGPAAARNKGVSLARGDVIAFLDDDDLWRPGKTAAQIRYLEENPECALVYSYPELIDEKGALIPNQPPARFPSGSVYLDFVKRNRISTPSATLVRKQVFYEAGFFDENREYICGEDYDLWLRIAEKYRVAFCPGTLVSYRIRGGGISRQLGNALKGDCYLLRKLFVRNAKRSEAADAGFYHAFDWNLYHTYRRYAFLYHYTLDDRREAASLLLAALHRHKFYKTCKEMALPGGLSLLFTRRRPYHLADLFYLALFCMPQPLFNFLRQVKRKTAL